MTHSDTSTTRGKIEVMEAAENGARIDSAIRTCGKPGWIYDDSPTWNWGSRDYRISPTSINPPKWRPWKMEEVPVGRVVIHKLSSGRLLIVSAAHNSVRVGQNGCASASTLLADYALLDGSPCGVREESTSTTPEPFDWEKMKTKKVVTY